MPTGLNQQARRVMHPCNHRHLGFTLIELVSILVGAAVVLCLLFVAFAGNREQAREITCEDNLRQLAAANLAYAEDWGGKFFYHWHRTHTKPNGEPGHEAGWWYDTARLGNYLPQHRGEQVPLRVFRGSALGPNGVRTAEEVLASDPTYAEYQHLKELVGGALVSPTHGEGVVRSYAMNYWASGVPRTNFVKSWTANGDITPEHGLGQFFDANADEQNRLMLLTVGHVTPLSEGRPYREDFFGGAGTPSSRFGGERAKSGAFLYTPPMNPLLIEHPNPRWLLDYSRYGVAEDASAWKPSGQVNIAFADGHVERVRYEDIYDETTLRSTYRVLWSPTDELVDQEYFSSSFYR